MNTNDYGSHYKTRAYFLLYALILIAFALFNFGCSGGGGGGHSTAKVEGHFFAGGAVEGLKYKVESTNDKSYRGVTDENGMFIYYQDDEVDSDITFFVDQLQLGFQVKAKSVMSPADIAFDDDEVVLANNGVVPIDFNTVVNMARFIQAIDIDGKPENGILIPKKLSLRSHKVSFGESNEDFTEDLDLKKLLIEIYDEKVYSEGYEPELPSAEYALDFLLKSVYPQGILLNELSNELSFPSVVNVIFQAKDVYGTAVDLSTRQFGQETIPENIPETIQNFILKETTGNLTNTISWDDPEYSPAVDQRDRLPYVLKCVLMIDRSSSVKEYLEEIKSAAKSILIDINEDGNEIYQQEWSIVQFSDPEEINKIINFTLLDQTGQSVLNNAIDTLSAETQPTTDLFGGIKYGLQQWTTTYKKEQIVQGILVVITDGQDTARTVEPSSIISDLGDEKVYIVLVGDEDKDNLDVIYKITGASIDLLKAQTDPPISEEVLDRLRLGKNIEYDSKLKFEQVVEGALGKVIKDKYFEQILELSTFKGETLKKIAKNGGFFSASDTESLSGIFGAIRGEIDNLMNSLYRLQYYSPNRKDSLFNQFDIALQDNYENDGHFDTQGKLTINFASEDFVTAESDRTYLNVTFNTPEGIGYHTISDARNKPIKILKNYKDIELFANTFYKSYISEFTWSIISDDSSADFIDVDSYYSSKATIYAPNVPETIAVVEVKDQTAHENETIIGEDYYTRYLAFQQKVVETPSDEDDEYTESFDTNFVLWEAQKFHPTEDNDAWIYHQDSDTVNSDGNYMISPALEFKTNYHVDIDMSVNSATISMSTDKSHWVRLYYSNTNRIFDRKVTIEQDSIQEKYDEAEFELFEKGKDTVDVYFKFSGDDTKTVFNNDLTIKRFRVGP